MVRWDFMEILLILTALANAVSAIIAWIAKIVWGKEYRKAKDEIIRAKEAEINTLKEYIITLEKLNPLILKQWYESGLEMARTYVSQVEEQLKEAQKKIEILETDQLQKSDLYGSAITAYHTLKINYDKLQAEVARGLLPTRASLATTAANSTVLARTTSTMPPPIENELLKFFSVYSDKACPMCQAQMLLNPKTGKHLCEECGYTE
jgi:DNA repair exonuclease SbcCD ATPase subunit